LEQGDKMGLSVAIKAFKYPNGAVNFNQLLRIPSNDRLPALIQKEGLERVHKLLGAAVQLALESLNLSQGLTANQVFDLVDNILDSSTEDYLGLEDVILFLQKLVRGEAGKLYKHIDIASFMEMFEKYRQERHLEYIRTKEEQHVQYKISGKSNIRPTAEKDKDIDPNTFFDLLQTYNENRDSDMVTSVD
jgi:hypothetical protein